MRSVAEIFSSHEVLDIEGRHINGTDKNGPNHNYGDAYESLFGEFSLDSKPKSCGIARNEVKLMMEVGVADGSSLCAWCEIFPNALCVGLDVHPSARASGERIEFHLGDATLRHVCERTAAGRMFDLIVDDATHLLEDTLRTLYWLWPSVAPGGLYVVEEWPTPDRARICGLWPQAELVDTAGPFGGNEPLTVFRKPK